MSTLIKIWYTAMFVSLGLFAIGMFGGLAWFPMFWVALVGMIGCVTILVGGVIYGIWREMF